MILYSTLFVLDRFRTCTVFVRTVLVPNKLFVPCLFVCSRSCVLVPYAPVFTYPHNSFSRHLCHHDIMPSVVGVNTVNNTTLNLSKAESESNIDANISRCRLQGDCRKREQLSLSLLSIVRFNVTVCICSIALALCSKML